MNPLEAEIALRTQIASYTHDPLGYVMFNFPWGQPGTELADSPGPRQWARRFLAGIGEQLRANKTSPMQVIREAVASGHGITKSATAMMLVKWALDTHEDTRVVITANTGTQLSTKTWPELVKWHRLSLTRHWFVITATAMYSADQKHERTWRADAIPWSEHNTEAFAGLHNAGKRIVVVFDEASAIADPVWDVTEGALTDEFTEILWLAFGNPTLSSGRFRECFRNQRKRWSRGNPLQIDSRTVEGTNKALLDQWVADYGEDSDFVKVRVRGLFPSLSLKGLFSETDVDGAFGKSLHPSQYEFAPKILSCDSAWTGGDPLIIGLRQGLAFQVLRKIPYNDNDVQVAGILGQLEDEHQADGVFIDLGHGSGIVSAGRTFGRSWTGVNFGGASDDEGCLNKRAEMYKLTRNWLKEGGVIPRDPALRQQMLDIEIKARPDNRLQLESKEEMRKRGLGSPNELDALVLTFAYPVTKKYRGPGAGRTQFAEMDYDPRARTARRR